MTADEVTNKIDNIFREHNSWYTSCTEGDGTVMLRFNSCKEEGLDDVLHSMAVAGIAFKCYTVKAPNGRGGKVCRYNINVYRT